MTTELLGNKSRLRSKNLKLEVYFIYKFTNKLNFKRCELAADTAHQYRSSVASACSAVHMIVKKL